MSAAATATGVQRTPVALPWLALLAGPLSFGITAPALVLEEIAAALGTTAGSAAALVTAFGWGIAVGSPLAGRLLARRGGRTTLTVSSALVVAVGMAAGPAAMGTVSGSLASFGAVAPLVGTQVAAALGWRAALVLPLLSLLAVPAALRAASTPTAAGRRDPLGATLLVTAVSALALVTALPVGWAVGAVVVAVAAGLLLARHARHRPDGVVPRSVPASGRFLLASAIAFGLAVANFAVVYASPRLLSGVTGWGPDQMGTALLVPYLAGGLLSLLLVPATARLRYRAVVLGFPACALAAVALALVGGSAVPLFAAMILGSVTAATGQGALGLRAGAAVDPEDREPALSLFTLCYLLGAAFGPAIAVAVV